MLDNKTNVRKDVAFRMRTIKENLKAIQYEFNKSHYYGASYVQEKANNISNAAQEFVRLAIIMDRLDR